MGRMPEADEILKKFGQLISSGDRQSVRKSVHLPLEGKRILITGGPTYEPIDPVRFVGNHSSGKMGAALALEASNFFGADVTLVMGPSAITTPPSINRIDVGTAEEMRMQVQSQLPGYDILIMSAAVSDLRPA